MRDYFVWLSDGSLVPVSRMPTYAIQRELTHPAPNEEGQATDEEFRERYLIELLIRERGWQAPENG